MLPPRITRSGVAVMAFHPLICLLPPSSDVSRCCQPPGMRLWNALAYEMRRRARSVKVETLTALSQLNATDRRENERAWKQPKQKRHNLDTDAGQNGALVGHQAAIPGPRDVRCRDVQHFMLKSRFKPGARLKL